MDEADYSMYMRALVNEYTTHTNYRVFELAEEWLHLSNEALWCRVNVISRKKKRMVVKVMKFTLQHFRLEKFRQYFNLSCIQFSPTALDDFAWEIYKHRVHDENCIEFWNLLYARGWRSQGGVQLMNNTARLGSLALVQWLIEHGHPVNETSKDKQFYFSPLDQVVISDYYSSPREDVGRREMMRLLLRHGAKLHGLDGYHCYHDMLDRSKKCLVRFELAYLTCDKKRWLLPMELTREVMDFL